MKTNLLLHSGSYAHWTVITATHNFHLCFRDSTDLILKIPLEMLVVSKNVTSHTIIFPVSCPYEVVANLLPPSGRRLPRNLWALAFSVLKHGSITLVTTECWRGKLVWRIFYPLASLDNSCSVTLNFSTKSLFFWTWLKYGVNGF